MPIVYFDSSALVKLLVQEDGSALARTLWDECDTAVSSPVAYPEVCAALAAAGRSHRIDRAALHAAERSWESIWIDVRTVALTTAVVKHAGDLAKLHAVRGADAVHLASALEFAHSAVIAVWDRRLSAGAEAAGLRVVPQIA